MKRSGHLEKKLDRILAEMEERDIALEGIDEKVDKFSNKVSEARKKLKQSHEKFIEAKAVGNGQERRDLLQEAKSLAKDAHDALKDAHDILRDVVKAIKESYGDADFEKERKKNQ